MTVSRVVDNSNSVVPLIASLPFEIEIEREDVPFPLQENYDPGQQRTIYAGRDYSTCREDDSAGGIFSSKSDTKKDD